MGFDIKRIRQDFAQLGVEQFYRQYIADNSNWYFSEYPTKKYGTPEEHLDILRTLISETTGVSYRSAHMVGSAKIGFSLDPKNPFLEFRKNGKRPSDIDIVVVSLRYFSRFWHQLQDEYRFRGGHWYNDHIMPSIFRGYIDDWAIKKIDIIRNEWDDVFLEAYKLLRNELNIQHTIHFRVYRSWEDFERYHLKGIEFLKKS